LREVGDHGNEANTLTWAGVSYSQMGNEQEALNYYNQALPLATAVKNPLLEARLFDRLLLSYKSQQPALAIYFGKQSVSLLQGLRANVQGADASLSSSLLSSNADNYHHLADLLIAQGRLAEAQQVLDMLKDQEYSEYVRAITAKTASPSLTPAERQGADDYQQATAQIVSLGDQWSQLQKIGSRTTEQERQFQQLSNQLSRASQGLSSYYTQLYELFGKNSSANRQVAEVKGSAALLKEQIANTPHSVALYTMIAKDRYSVIVITGTAMVAREFRIEEEDLNRKIDAFSKALRNPSEDPRPEAQELYKILIGPVKADLDQAQARTLVWVLDGKLRYIPMDALYDGKQYLLESYNSVSITPVSIPHLAEKPTVPGMNITAMGISRKYDVDLPELPAVLSELNQIVDDAQVQGARGVLPGRILLNGEFTETAMENQLGAQRAVVHIASHFVFQPGDDNQSYLLLAGKDQAGNGYHLTVADFRDDQKLSLEHADLLTLSACETGVNGNTSDGREVDGLATTAQLKGAKSVISSLWDVNDLSTGKLMADFYRRWAAGQGSLEKVEALRQAKLDLLLGKTTPEPNALDRGFRAAQNEHLSFPGYTHPYYWAPFVLSGNWK
jgi:CHAT domain-containing protein